METLGMSPAARGLSGSGKTVLHNLKNWGCEIEMRRTTTRAETDQQDTRAFGDAVCRFFAAARRVCNQSVEDGCLPADTSTRLNQLLTKHEEDASALRDGKGDILKAAGVSDFLHSQYAEQGLLVDILDGETVCLFSDLPLTPIERALRKVVQALAPTEWVRDGRLIWEDTGSGKALCIKRAASGGLLRLGIVVMPSEFAPKDLSRIPGERQVSV